MATTTITEARMILRDLLAAPQRMSASARLTRAATSVTNGALWRRDIAKANAEVLWLLNGRMMKAGTKNHAVPARAAGTKKNQRILRRGCMVNGGLTAPLIVTNAAKNLCLVSTRAGPKNPRPSEAWTGHSWILTEG